MKIMLFSDCHWSTTTSIIRGRGDKYSTRLEYLIKSLNWVEEAAIKNNCDLEICLGDFFDKTTITDEEAAALKDIKWNNLKKYFIVGNHESGQADLQYSTAKVLETDNINIINKLTRLDFDNIYLYLLPYIAECNKAPLETLLEQTHDTAIDSSKKKIVCSHNDISGISYAGFISQLGFSIEEIEKSSDLFLNGHLHNATWVSSKILNVGSFSGHNFTNDAHNYNYGIWILDTDTLQVTFIENPFSLNFYKFEILTENDVSKLDTIKNNAVLSIKCTTKLKTAVDEKLEMLKSKIVDSRMTLARELTTVADNNEVISLHTDYLSKLIECCKMNIANSQILDIELSEICK